MTTTAETTTIAAGTVATRYIAAFNETDPTVRRDLIARTFTVDATYVDPLMSGDGAGGIDAMIVGVQGQLPGFSFRRAGKVDGYPDRLRFAWELLPPGADAPGAGGTDFALLASDGRLRAVTGFLDLMPSPDHSPPRIDRRASTGQ